jgi:hypothetical protein
VAPKLRPFLGFNNDPTKFNLGDSITKIKSDGFDIWPEIDIN